MEMEISEKIIDKEEVNNIHNFFLEREEKGAEERGEKKNRISIYFIKEGLEKGVF